MAAQTIVTTDPTKHWCRKMKTHFRNSVGTKGYITEEEMMERTCAATLKVYPELNAEELKKQVRHSWIHDLNCGMEPPPGYRLTEAQYVQNMWVMVNQPSFRERTSEMTAKVFEQMDKEKKGHLTKDQFLQMSSKVLNEKGLQGLYDVLDETKQGKVTRDALERAYIHFFTDTCDEEHPFNLLRGPLVD